MKHQYIIGDLGVIIEKLYEQIRNGILSSLKDPTSYTST